MRWLVDLIQALLGRRTPEQGAAAGCHAMIASSVGGSSRRMAARSVASYATARSCARRLRADESSAAVADGSKFTGR
jgi:hypothetical protein